MASTKNGILFDYDWCTGCHSCEIACQMEHNFSIGQSGVFLYEVGPYVISGEKFREDWQYAYQIAFTKQCDLCAERVEQFGKLPSCVHHCQAKCLEYGPVDELLKKAADKTKQCLFIPA